ncbi:MAG: methyltransferase RsmF C-terminal domain-like protein [Candidatus Woesearchaeota archaeon]
MNLTIYNSREKKKFLKMLKEQFDFELDQDYFFMESSKQKIYVINTELTNIYIDNYRIDSMGLYIGKYQSDGFRPSIEGSQIIGPRAKKNVLDITLEQRHSWLKGEDLAVNVDNGIYIVKCEDDFIGSGTVKNNILLTGIPKSRRLIVVNE